MGMDISSVHLVIKTSPHYRLTLRSFVIINTDYINVYIQGTLKATKDSLGFD